MQKNIAFLLGHEPDANGLTVNQYLHFHGVDWEQQHDVIQMAFPTKTQSKFHPEQPFLPAEFDMFDLEEDEQQRLKATISLLLHSYLKSLEVEFLINHDNVSITMKPLGVAPYWANSRDHNTLRLSRILECLDIFEMRNIQKALFEFLVYDIGVTYYNDINAKTVAYWVAARENRLRRIR